MHQLPALPRIRAADDDVAEDDDRVVPGGADVPRDGEQRREVAVDVGDDRELHGFPGLGGVGQPRGHSSRVNFPSCETTSLSMVTRPPFRRSTTMSQCRPEVLVFPVSG